jgi:hypothetical protein
MLRADLAACGIPSTIDGPDGPLHADFHALRHSCVALLDWAGLTLKQAMQPARQSDPKLTMAVYGRAQLHDLGARGRGHALLADTRSVERDVGPDRHRHGPGAGPRTAWLTHRQR